MRYSNNANYAKNITPEFFLKNEASENTFYSLAGVVKPGTISYIKGTDEISFILTDFEHEIRVFYKGIIPNNFLEGGTVVATGCITDKNRPNIFMSSKVGTDHGYNSDKWISKNIFNIKLPARKLQISDKNRADIVDRMMKKSKEAKAI